MQELSDICVKRSGAELRSAWTGEPQRPHMIHNYSRAGESTVRLAMSSKERKSSPFWNLKHRCNQPRLYRSLCRRRKQVQLWQELPPHSHPARRRKTSCLGSTCGYGGGRRRKRSGPPGKVRTQIKRLVDHLPARRRGTSPHQIEITDLRRAPRGVPCLALEKTVERAFESIGGQEEHDRTRRELRRAVSDLER